MKTCKKCHTKFKNHIFIDGKIRNLQRRIFCLICSPWNTHNTKNLNEIKEIPTHKICPRCTLLIPIDQYYLRKDGRLLTYCKSCTNTQTVERTRAIKKEAIEYKGGKCLLCGYSKCYRNLHFHHLDPESKSFGISVLRTSSIERLKPELDKCVLLCANCHGEVEDGLIKIPSPRLELGTTL